MKQKFFERIVKWSCSPMLVLVLLFSCEKQSLTEKEIQREILQDEDFLSMMSEIFISEYTKEAKSTENQGTVNSYIEILEERHNDFYKNMQTVLSDKTTSDYISFSERLLLKVQQSNDQLARVGYDAGSVCGVSSCGSTQKDASALTCITGALASQLFCEQNSMGKCEAMKEFAVGQCCSIYCTPKGKE